MKQYLTPGEGRGVKILLCYFMLQKLERLQDGLLGLNADWFFRGLIFFFHKGACNISILQFVHYASCGFISIKAWESPPCRVNDREKHEVLERQQKEGGWDELYCP